MQQLQNNAPLTSARPEETLEGSAQEKYIINTLIGAIHTCTLVKVISVTVPQDELAPIGRCSIQPLVQKIDGNNNVYPRGVIDNVPYLRVQGGANAVVIDPVAGDIGLAAFCDRDISMVKRTGEEAAPNSLRQYDLNDAVYLYTCMAGTPTQYIHFKGNEIHVKSPSKIILDAPTVQATGQINAEGDVTAGDISLQTHVHGGVQSGPSTTGGPQ